MVYYKEKQILNFLIFFEIHLEKRNSSSFSIRHDKVIVRLPKLLSRKEIDVFLEKAVDWTSKQLLKNPKLQNSLPIKSFPDQFSIQFCGINHYFKIEKSNYIIESRSIGDKHSLILSPIDSKWEAFKQVSKMISNIAKRCYAPIIKMELYQLHSSYSNKPIGQIRMKYNKTNWGSCSSRNNINLNTRLVLLPKEVRSYIMLHEIAHLHHMDHSAKFWNLLASWQPNYNDHIQYLNDHHSSLDFYHQLQIDD
ncbi:M48 family metallopeptidase [Membranihabitans marinus]|uniref:M48 family metallopeptidase n=1 Tax=Membranihabitans marinus TaxID=1227546 RepID=UPI001F2043C6|nr:YgjP-like metallopeptidase domain-containing protein [Membranihabitans marinus]